MAKQPKIKDDNYESAYIEIMQAIVAPQIPADQMRFRTSKVVRRVETFTTYGAYEMPI